MIFIRLLTFPPDLAGIWRRDLARFQRETIATMVHEHVNWHCCEGIKTGVVAGAVCEAEVKAKAAVHDWLTTLDPTVLDSIVTEKAMTMMSDDVSNVIHIGKIMGFPQGKLQAYQSEHPFCVANQASCMFSDWRSKNSDRATVAEFVKLLREAGIDDNRLKCVFLKEYSRPGDRKPAFV